MLDHIKFDYEVYLRGIDPGHFWEIGDGKIRKSDVENVMKKLVSL